MMRRYSMLVSLLIVGACVGWGASQNQPKDGQNPVVPKVFELDTTKEDLRVVREGGLKGESADLLKYFRERTFKQPDPKEIAALVRLLGDEEFNAREEAFVKLMNLGASALAGLKAAEADPDLEIRKRVGELKARVEGKAEPILQAAAARLLARQKPAETADVLLKFLPFSTDPMVVDEVAKALGAVAVLAGKADPLVVKSLEDANPVKRGAAGEALVRAGAKDEFGSVKKLLKDADVSVRQRVCMAMLPIGDKAIVPVMVELMGQLSPNELWPIEEALLRLAGEKAPSVSLGSDDAGRKVCRDAWAKWFGENEKTLDMAKLVQDNIVLGYTLIVQHLNVAGRGQVGEIFELDSKKAQRWKFDINTYPVDAHMVGPERVLIAEYQGNRVTERNIKGTILWDYNCGGNPIAVQRLPNGNTFVTMPGRLVEVDRNKNEVWSYQRPQGDMFRAKRLPSGEVAFITNVGAYTRMDPKTQKVSKSFSVGQVGIQFGNWEVLPNGNVLVPQYGQSRVVEYDDGGKQVGNPFVGQQWPNSVARLSNGHTLISSQHPNTNKKIAEYDANRGLVWEHTTVGSVFVTRKR